MNSLFARVAADIEAAVTPVSFPTPQPVLTDPHWIVRRVAVDGAPPEWKKVKEPFRHASEAAAMREARRLAAHNPGHRFAVYGLAAVVVVDEKDMVG